AGGAEPRSSIGDPKDVGRHVVVDPVEPPQAAIVRSGGVVGPIQQTARENRLDRIGGIEGELEIEVIEWTVIVIPGLARQAVGEAQARHLLADVQSLSGRWRTRIGIDVYVGGEMRKEVGADVHSGEDRGIIAAEYGFEAVAIHESIEAGGRRDDGGSHFAPPRRTLVGAGLEQQARHPEKRLAEEI